MATLLLKHNGNREQIVGSEAQTWLSFHFQLISIDVFQNAHAMLFLHLFQIDSTLINGTQVTVIQTCPTPLFLLQIEIVYPISIQFSWFLHTHPSISRFFVTNTWIYLFYNVLRLVCSITYYIISIRCMRIYHLCLTDNLFHCVGPMNVFACDVLKWIAKFLFYKRILYQAKHHLNLEHRKLREQFAIISYTLATLEDAARSMIWHQNGAHSEWTVDICYQNWMKKFEQSWGKARNMKLIETHVMKYGKNCVRFVLLQQSTHR